MTIRTITAMFKTREEAERAGQMLVSEMHADRATISVSPGAGVTDTGYNAAQPYQETGFLASLKNMFLPEEDRFGYAEGMRRGGVLLSAKVDDSQIDRASEILEQAGAQDLDEQEKGWRQSGWAGYDANAASTGRGTVGSVGGAAALRPGQDETIKLVEEKLVVGKRDVERGRVRVRSYVVETPVEEQIKLHDERVTLDRRPVDRAATAADGDFAERTIAATAMGEEAVISKTVRVKEEIGIHKEAADRTETVRDTVRHTEVEIENSADKTRTAPAGTGTTGAGTGVAGAIDRNLGTNLSGTNPKI